MAVHVLALLAYKEGDRITSAFLAQSINTNPVIIRRLLLALQKAKLVDTCKGAGAGSRLGRSPQRINMAEIYRSVEDCEPFARPARKPRADCPVGNCMTDALAGIFASAERAMEQDLAKTTLADILTIAKDCAQKQEKKAAKASV